MSPVATALSNTFFLARGESPPRLANMRHPWIAAWNASKEEKKEKQEKKHSNKG